MNSGILTRLQQSFERVKRNFSAVTRILLEKLGPKKPFPFARDGQWGGLRGLLGYCLE